MDIFSRPPTISEDTLQYALYPPNDLSDKSSALALATVIQAFVDTSLSADFLWHRDTFELKVICNPESDGWILDGTMRVGDSVDDEWCVVWLLREISMKWDVVISVFDSDGEFLLIEAAEHLPSWVTPSNAENRIWIYNSHLHLVPLSYLSSPSSKIIRRQYTGIKDSDDEGNKSKTDDGGFINPSDAIEVVRDPSRDTLAPIAVEQTVWQRIARYPVALKEHVHVTRAWLPTDIANVLRINPALAQKPVETFYTRDAIQLRAVHRMARFPPQPSVLTTVKLTRTAYAQLCGQKFHPPKTWSRWQEVEGTREWKWKDVGMKLACGFEILYQESKNRSDATKVSSSISDEARKEALHRDQEYVQYIQNLQSSGYFKLENEGSELWKKLENKAVGAFISARREDDATRRSFALEINTALSQATEIDFSNCPEEESDNWLNIDETGFETMLQSSMGQSKTDANAMDVDDVQDRVVNDQASKLQNLAKKVEEFVEGEGDLEGAKFADDMLSDEDFSDGSSDSDDESDEETRQRRREIAMESLVPALDPADYGKMPPAFYVNSQKVSASEELQPQEDTTATEEGSVPFGRPLRPPILPRDTYDGVDSDDETDEEEDMVFNDESDEDHPEVVDEIIEPDMAEEEDEFLEFSRRALGISNDEWNAIIDDRKSRGAFVPFTVPKQDYRPSMPTDKSSPVMTNESRRTTSGPRANGNQQLDSFESVMQAMDVELARMTNAKAGRTEQDKGKGKAAESDLFSDANIDTSMEAELRATLEGEDEDDEEDTDTGINYNMIKNFLESFKSQAGLSGPVSNLAGRLQPDWTMPRDDS